MVTKEDLLKDDAERAAKKELERLKSEEESNSFRKELTMMDENRAAILLNEDLGEFIREMNRQGMKFISLEEYKVWKKDGREIYTPNFPTQCGKKTFKLGFTPNPNYEPTKILIEKLCEAGFEAKVREKEEQNYHFVTRGDDYDIVYTNGTYTRYFLDISWE